MRGISNTVIKYAADLRRLNPQKASGSGGVVCTLQMRAAGSSSQTLCFHLDERLQHNLSILGRARHKRIIPLFSHFSNACQHDYGIGRSAPIDLGLRRGMLIESRDAPTELRTTNS
jgi:hypothetical protein